MKLIVRGDVIGQVSLNSSPKPEHLGLVRIKTPQERSSAPALADVARKLFPDATAVIDVAHDLGGSDFVSGFAVKVDTTTEGALWSLHPDF